MQLIGKTAIITGASSGIGRAAALMFAANGASVVAAARRQDKLDELVDEIQDAGGSATALAGDVGDETYQVALVDNAVSVFGGLDIGFNNAGVLGAMGETASIALDDWNAALETNLTAAFLGAKHQIGAMRQRGGGSLVFTSSFVGHGVGFPGMAAYAAAKAGLIGMTQCLASELGRDNIRVNTLLPGGTKTAMADTFAPDAAAQAEVAAFHALKRLADPEEIAAAALFLASDTSSFVTGAALVADGGNSISKV